MFNKIKDRPDIYFLVMFGLFGILSTSITFLFLFYVFLIHCCLNRKYHLKKVYLTNKK